MSACDRCHRRKSRCDKQHPCTDCQKANVDCSYTDRTRASTRADVEALQNRLRELESKNKENELRLYEQTPIELKTRGNEKSRQGSLPAARHSQEVPISSFSSHEEVDRGIAVPITHLSPMISSTPVAPLSDVMSEVSFLASNAAGERQFLGSTSGVLFANLVRASVNVSEPEEAISSKRRRVSGNGVQPRRVSYKNTLVAAETLPPENLARKLVDSYLFHDHIAYPFLLPSYILSISDAIYKDPKFYVNNIFEAFVFDMVLAIANANVYKYDWQMLPSAEVHHSRAMVHLTEVFQSGGLKSLQAILLLCQYRTGSSIQDTSASMWHLVGIAVRTAFELGLHRESGYLLKSNENISIEAFREQEVRRRCFWCVFAMDRVVSITLGRPLAINIDDVDVELPKSDNDRQFNVGIPGQESLRRTSTFVHIVQYRILCGKVMRGLHGLKRPNHDESAIYRLRDSLADELTRWWQNTECLELIETGTSSPLPQQRSCFRSKEWYEILYQNAVLMLFRPTPMLSDISKEPATLQKIFGSSKQAILLYASLHRSRKINYSWITLHAVFMAGLSYIYTVSCHFREQRRPSPTGVMLSSDPKPMELVNDTRACSNVLVAVSERWNALRHCHEVFDRLSDAVLEDAIKLHTNPKKDQQSLQSTQPSIYYGNSLDRSTQSHMSSSFLSDAAQSSNWIGSCSAIVSQSNNYTQPSPLAVDAEFRNCFGDLQNLYHEQYNDDPVIQLSQDWLGYLNDYNGILPG